VYRASDPRLGREVAVKVLPEAFACDPERMRRFEAEAKAAGALNHPNILVVHDIGAESGLTYLVSELLEGESLRERLKKGKLPPARAAELGRQIAEGLRTSKERGNSRSDMWLGPSGRFTRHSENGQAGSLQWKTRYPQKSEAIQ